MLVELGAPDGLEQAVAGQDQDLGVRPVLEQLQDLLDGAERLAQPQPRFEHRCRVEETINATAAAPAFEVSLMRLGVCRRSPRNGCCAVRVDPGPALRAESADQRRHGEAVGGELMRYPGGRLRPPAPLEAALDRAGSGDGLGRLDLLVGRDASPNQAESGVGVEAEGGAHRSSVKKKKSSALPLASGGHGIWGATLISSRWFVISRIGGGTRRRSQRGKTSALKACHQPSGTSTEPISLVVRLPGICQSA